MAFTISDYRFMQRHLNLSITSLEDGSILRQNAKRIEEIDAAIGSPFLEDEMRVLLTNLNTLEDEIDEEFTTSNLGVKSWKVDGQVSVDYGNNLSGELIGKITKYEKFLKELRRELGFEFETYYQEQIGVIAI